MVQDQGRSSVTRNLTSDVSATSQSKMKRPMKEDGHKIGHENYSESSLGGESEKRTMGTMGRRRKQRRRWKSVEKRGKAMLHSTIIMRMIIHYSRIACCGDRIGLQPTQSRAVIIHDPSDDPRKIKAVKHGKGWSASFRTASVLPAQYAARRRVESSDRRKGLEPNRLVS